LTAWSIRRVLSVTVIVVGRANGADTQVNCSQLL
jgi:hypothetical protein